MTLWWKFVCTVVIASFLFGVAVIVATSPAHCWGCFGGPCVTSTACVEGCHCIAGRCG